MSDKSKKGASNKADEPKKAADKPKAAASGSKKVAGSKSTASKSAASKSAASKSTASKSTGSKSTASKSTASKSTASKSAARNLADEKAPAAAAVAGQGARTDHVSTDSPKSTPGRSVVSNRKKSAGLTSQKLLAVLGLMFVAFLGAYNYAANSGTANAAGVSSIGGALAAGDAAPAGGGCGMSGGSGGGGCCGGGGAPVEGATTVSGGVQTVDVDTSQGSFNPNIIKAKAGVPIEIAFSQAPGGCLSGVSFPDFDINEDLTGGPKTVKLPALDPGEYTFYCQMQMVSATLVVE